jgi:hypothetical protein
VGIGRAKKWLLDYSRTNESTKLILKTQNYNHPLKSEYVSDYDKIRNPLTTTEGATPLALAHAMGLAC